MSFPSPAEHVYERLEHGGEQDSLQLVLAHINPAWEVLDLGMGAGGLARARQALGHVGATDGVTLSEREAELGAAACRHVEVADLDLVDVASLFYGQRYDAIVCADVLEHLKAPERLLNQCKASLAPHGRLIASVPNVGHAGLLAELLQGEWRYRPEGLLDQTHVRFFTRRSLERFFDAQGWRLKSLQTTTRQLGSTEFQVAFDALPPTVARHILAMPDALTYQFVVELEPSGSDVPLQAWPNAVRDRLDVCADFSAALYPAVLGAYDEATKIVARGSIGCEEQWLTFALPPTRQAYSALRLDPADRPGYLHLRELVLQLPDGVVAWQWRASDQPVQALLGGATHELLALLGDAGQTTLLLLGDDPWFELPLSEAVLYAVAWRGATLRVQLGWPMSADYRPAVQQICVLQDTIQQQAASISGALQKYEQHTQMQQATQAHLESEIDDLRGQLRRIEQSTIFRVTRPLVRLKEALDRALGRVPKGQRHADAAPSLPSRGETPKLPDPRELPARPLQSSGPRDVDIVVPVYADAAATQRCINSVLSSACRATWRLVIVDDCGPEPELSAWLCSLADQNPRVTLLRNANNLGFVASVNRGMALHDNTDVLLLNSDTEVANDWLDRLQSAAYRAPDIASVTPFSNNATICSYPRFCADNALPQGLAVAELDALFASQMSGQAVDVPTGVGFCMYVRRDALAQVGSFDVERFGRGYGEENDFCMRAKSHGWRHVHALDTFVWHQGGVSFGPEKVEREAQAMVTLRQSHPDYEGLVHAFLKRDPARLARRCIDLARLRREGTAVVLLVLHDREGGTLRHVQELTQRFSEAAIFLCLLPTVEGVRLLVPLGEQGVAGETHELQFALPEQGPGLLDVTRQLQVSMVHVHHTLGHHEWVDGLAHALGVPLLATVHDYYAVCPQISLTDARGRYCGEQGVEQCRACLAERPAQGGVSIERWRARHAALLNGARAVLVPSQDAGARMTRYVPDARFRVAPHEALTLPVPHPVRPELGRRLRVVVIGAMSAIKGADILEAVAQEALRQGAPVDIHLLGYAYRDLTQKPETALTVHGRYVEADLPALLKDMQPDLAWFPALWPETYSYTLSAALQAGIPVLASDLGAFRERLQEQPLHRLLRWDSSPCQWLDAMQIMAQGGGLQDAPASGECMPRPPLRGQFDWQADYLTDGRMG